MLEVRYSMSSAPFICCSFFFILSISYLWCSGFSFFPFCSSSKGWASFAYHTSGVIFSEEFFSFVLFDRMTARTKHGQFLQMWAGCNFIHLWTFTESEIRHLQDLNSALICSQTISNIPLLNAKNWCSNKRDIICRENAGISTVK